MKSKKRNTVILFVVLVACMLCACTAPNEKKAKNDKTIEIYYLNKEETRVVMEEYQPVETTTEALLPEIIGILGTQPENVDLREIGRAHV